MPEEGSQGESRKPSFLELRRRITDSTEASTALHAVLNGYSESTVSAAMDLDEANGLIGMSGKVDAENLREQLEEVLEGDFTGIDFGKLKRGMGVYDYGTGILVKERSKTPDEDVAYYVEHVVRPLVKKHELEDASEVNGLMLVRANIYSEKRRELMKDAW